MPSVFSVRSVSVGIASGTIVALALLFGLTGMAAYVLGGIMTLNHLVGVDVGDDPRLHRVTPSRGNERSPS